MEVSVKKSKWLLVAGLVIMMMAVGCKKMGDPVDVANVATDPLVLPLIADGGVRVVGHVLVWDDASDLYITYKLDVPQADGHFFEMIQGCLDVELYPADFPVLSTGAPWLVKFGSVADVPWPYVPEFTQKIPLVGGWQAGLSVVVAARAKLFEYEYKDGPYLRDLGAWAGYPDHPFLDENHGWWFPYKLGKPGDWCAGTAWGGHARPQWDMWEFPGNNWALYLRHTLGDDPYVGDLYWGNPKNDPAGHDVGSVTVWDDVVGGVGNIYVKYETDRSGYSISSGHTIVRGALEDIPQNNGNPPPGQFDYIWGPFDPTVGDYTVTIKYDPAWGTDLYIGAHAIAGYYK